LEYVNRAKELSLSSRTKLFVNFKRAELELQKRFVSNSSRISSQTNSYRVEPRRFQFDSTHFQPYSEEEEKEVKKKIVTTK